MCITGVLIHGQFRRGVEGTVGLESTGRRGEKVARTGHPAARPKVVRLVLLVEVMVLLL